MITEQRVTEVLKEAGVLLEGHFLLTSGRHSNKYLQCARIFRNTKYSEELCSALAELYADYDVQLIIGPAMGAVQMAYEVSRHFGCENFFTERDENGAVVLRRGFVIEPGQRVLVVEDVVTTGGSVKEVIALIQHAGGVVAGVGSIVDRTGGKIDFGVPFKAVYSADVASWEATECPLCKAGIHELVKPGSRKK